MPLTITNAIRLALPCMLLAASHAQEVQKPKSFPSHMTVGEHDEPVKYFGFLDEGKSIASANSTGVIKVWGVDSNEELKSYNGSNSSAAVDTRITNFQVSRDGEVAAVAIYGVIYFVETKTGKDLGRRIYPMSHVVPISEPMVWGPKGEDIFTVTPRGDVARTPRTNKGGYEKVEEKVPPVTALALDKSGKYLAAACEDGSIVIVKTQNMQVQRTLKGSQPSVECVAMHPKGTDLATGSKDKTILLWKRTQAERMMELKGHEGEVTALVYHADGKVLVSGDSAGSVKLWNLKTGDCFASYDHQGDGRINALAFDPDGKVLAAAGLSKGVTLWDIADLL